MTNSLWAICNSNEEIVAAFSEENIIREFKRKMGYSKIKKLNFVPDLPYLVKGPKKIYGAFESKCLAESAIELDNNEHKLLIYPSNKTIN